MKNGTNRFSRGFTLIEVLLTVSLLALATVFIVQANLLSSSVYGRYANRLEVQNWAAQKIWKIKEGLLAEDFPDVSTTEGSVDGATRTYRWKAAVEEQKDKLTSLFLIHLEVLWREGGQDNQLDRYGALLKLRDK